MFARAATGAVIGIEAQPVLVESHRAHGLPGMALIGLARGAVKESAVRVRSAILALGLHLGSHRLVVNLLPAELPKDASALDLALAASLLASGGALPQGALEGRLFYGELSLGGALEPVRGAVLLADLARRQKVTELIVPQANAAEAAIIPGVRVLGAAHLGDVVAHLKGDATLTAASTPPADPTAASGCFSEVHGQVAAKRALELAAAGGHNLLMIGPPGSGKTMLARRLPGLLPPLDAEESIEVTRIHSAAGMSFPILQQRRPFRAPHHTASEPALCGGGALPRPGEITLAHRGVLFLDEFPEFSRRALESLREPLEEGFIHIARAALSLRFPADVLLVAAMNPCPCGYFRGDRPAGDRGGKPCICAYEQIQKYTAKISGPLLDRIDMHVAVEAVPYRDFARRGSGEPSAVIRQRVLQARRRQHERLGPGRTNASMSQAELQRAVCVGDAAMTLIEDAIESHGLSTRAIGRILKVARTVADVASRDEVHPEHIREAVELRLLDRNSPLI